MKKSSKLFLKSIGFYAFILIIVFVILFIGYVEYDYPVTSDINARYLLSAFSQSQAAILAIVTTLSLIAVQLTASVYSPRIISIFKKNPDIWILITLYLISISYNMIILKNINPNLNEIYILIAYGLSFSGFAMLIPYFYSIINILTPERAIVRLSNDIPDSIIKDNWDGDDPFQPFMDIIIKSFNENDYSTAKIGLNTISDKTIKCISSYNSTINKNKLKRMKYSNGKIKVKSVYKQFAKYYIENLQELGELFSEKNEKLTIEVIKKLKDFLNEISRVEIGVESNVISSLKSIGDLTIEKKYRETTREIFNVIGKSIKNIPFDKYDNNEVFKYMEDLVHAFFYLSPPSVMKWKANILQTIGRHLEEILMLHTVKNSKDMDINDKTRMRMIIFTYRDIILIILTSENYYSEINDGLTEVYGIKPLYKFAKISFQKGLKELFSDTVSSLILIGLYTYNNINFMDSLEAVIDYLSDMAILDKKIFENEFKKVEENKRKAISKDIIDKFKSEINKRYLEKLNKIAKNKKKNKNKKKRF